MGTATTFDAISAAGEYLGGAITPGVGISLEALFQQAAALRPVELVEPRNVIGRSTAESIQSGALYGSAELVDGLCRRFKDELGSSTAVVATGGLAELIAPYTEMVDHVEPWLTLEGLRVVYERNVGRANGSRH
jgi:type III pantothenate kinase